MARICRLSACAEGPEGSFFRGIMAPHATLSGVTWAQSHMRGRAAVVVAALESGGRAPECGRRAGQQIYSRRRCVSFARAHFPCDSFLVTGLAAFLSALASSTSAYDIRYSAIRSRPGANCSTWPGSSTPRPEATRPPRRPPVSRTAEAYPRSPPRLTASQPR